MTIQINDKPTAKTVIRDVIDAQPEDASYEEIMRELAFDRMIERGLADIKAGRCISHEAAVRRIHSWQN